MNRWIHRLAAITVIVATAPIVPSAIPAQAATPAPTLLRLSPTPVSYPGMQVTVTGTLATKATTPQPVPGEQVSISFYGGCPGRRLTLVATATTGPDGSFTANATLPLTGAGEIVATFAGDASYAAAQTTRQDSPLRMPTRITLDPLPATMTGYSQVPVSGRVEVQAPDQTWLPADCAWVEILGNSTDSQSVTATGADGTFTGVLNVEDTGPFQARTYPWEYSFTEYAASATQSAQITPGQTQVADFAPAVTPEIAQDSLSFTARSQALATTPYSSVWVNDTLDGQLWFRPAGTSTWTLQATAPLSGSPITAIPGYLPDGQPAEGSWQIRTLATPILQASASPVITVPVKVRTWLNDTTITTSGTRRHLTGTLDDQPATGPVPGQQIRLSYRLPGTHTWHYAATALTGAHGKFSFPITATGRWYRVSYPGHGYYLPATSHAIYQP